MNKKDSIYSRKDSRNSRIPARLSGRESVRLSFPRNGILDNSRATLSAEPVHAAELTSNNYKISFEPELALLYSIGIIALDRLIYSFHQSDFFFNNYKTLLKTIWVYIQ
jgi:hypothetical protein